VDDREINNLLDAIKMMTGGYRARGEEMQITPQKSKWGDFQARDEDGYLLYNEDFTDDGKMVPYEANLSREQAYTVMDALRNMAHYRPMPEDVGSPEYDQELMRRYKQFFGFK